MNWAIDEYIGELRSWPKTVRVHRAGDFRDYLPVQTTTRSGKFKTKYGRKVPLCECCGYSIGDSRYNFCPKCGAKIEVEK